MTANDFSPAPSQGYHFGVGKAETAAALRKLADDVESGIALPQTVRCMSTASNEDYTMHLLRLSFAKRTESSSSGAVSPGS